MFQIKFYIKDKDVLKRSRAFKKKTKLLKRLDLFTTATDFVAVILWKYKAFIHVLLRGKILEISTLY